MLELFSLQLSLQRRQSFSTKQFTRTKNIQNTVRVAASDLQSKSDEKKNTVAKKIIRGKNITTEQFQSGSGSSVIYISIVR